MLSIPRVAIQEQLLTVLILHELLKTKGECVPVNVAKLDCHAL
jgi:hypothetical protein